MTTDPSWLYSTIAQSSAAIVAIIGGFITAAVMKLISERDALKRELESDIEKLDTYQNTRVDMDAPNVQVLKVQVSALEDKLKAFNYPPNLTLGILVLVGITVFSIFLPIITISERWFFVWLKYLLLATFTIGLVGLFTYITLQIHELRRK